MLVPSVGSPRPQDRSSFVPRRGKVRQQKGCVSFQSSQDSLFRCSVPKALAMSVEHISAVSSWRATTLKHSRASCVLAVLPAPIWCPKARRIALSQCWDRAASTSLVQLSWSVMGLMPPFGFGNPMRVLLCHSAATGLDTFPPVQRFTQASAVSSPSSVCNKSIHKPFRQRLGLGSASNRSPLMHRARVRSRMLVCGASFACCLAFWKACWVTCGSGGSGAITSQVAWTVARVGGSLGPSLSNS